MGYPIPTFAQIRQTILQEVRNLTGVSAPDDSDAAIRADGEAAVVEGLYQQQKWIERQLFIQTADEQYLYIHAEKLGLPRLGGTRASGSVQALANTDLTIADTAKLTDGKGHYWSVAGSIDIAADTPTTVEILADEAGAAWNFSSASLMWVAPEAGLQSTADVISVTGGSDEEDLEDWRARLLERSQLGISRDRAADIVSAMHSISSIEDVFIFPKRRGLGSLDVAITAKGNPPTLPSQSLLNEAQAVLDEAVAFWADCRVYAPTVQAVDVTAKISGIGANVESVRQVIKDYFAELAPADSYQAAVLISRILTVANVVDVTLTPNSNIVPRVDWQYTVWLRLGELAVSG